mmetsp:Transcript_83049/g.211376  ORF Transcript_83049/g.211376 Transcript_83049/m.211376 type:complete len:222 (+) Transcript_83049:1133-1798(+)
MGGTKPQGSTGTVNAFNCAAMMKGGSCDCRGSADCCGSAGLPPSPNHFASLSNGLCVLQCAMLGCSLPSSPSLSASSLLEGVLHEVGAAWVSSTGSNEKRTPEEDDTFLGETSLKFWLGCLPSKVGYGKSKESCVVTRPKLGCEPKESWVSTCSMLGCCESSDSTLTSSCQNFGTGAVCDLPKTGCGVEFPAEGVAGAAKCTKVLWTEIAWCGIWAANAIG